MSNKENQNFLHFYSYSEEKKLGHGSLGDVYEAIREKPNENSSKGKFALKIIKKDKLNNSSRKKLVQNEIQTLKKLRNIPEIVHFYEHVQLKNEVCLVLELCKGGTLRDKVKLAPLPQQSVLSFMRKILKGYLSMVKAKIIHRDLKPENILLDEDENIKIADFGFAIFEDEIQNEKSTKAGSHYYMPPQVMKNNSYSYKSDVWALGVIFYELAVGKRPWSCKSQKQLLNLMENVSIENLMNSDIDSKIKKILKRALNPNIKQRADPFQLWDLLQENENVLQKKQTIESQPNLLRSQVALVQLCHLKYYLVELIEKQGKKGEEKIFKSQVIGNLKQSLAESVFCELNKIQMLQYVIEDRQFFKGTSEYKMLVQMIQCYKKKYTRFSAIVSKANFTQTLNQAIIFCYKSISQQSSYAALILYDYLICLRWLTDLLLKEGLFQFHEKSSVEDMVEGLKKETKESKNKKIREKQLKRLEERLVKLCLLD